jgi:hypothetical protein
MRLQKGNTLLLSAGFVSFFPQLAFAHAGSRGHVLLLPTQLYIVGGAAVVALTFALMIFVVRQPLSGQYQISHNAENEVESNYWLSLLSLLTLLLLVWIGFTGNRDPIQNLLPLTVWVFWWIGFTMLTALFGNLWAVISPWPILQKLVSLFTGAKTGKKRSFVEAERWAYWPAVILFFGFAWLELVHPSPMDPETLAGFISLYALLTTLGMVVFGGEFWLKNGEPFSVFFRMVGWLAPFYLKSSPAQKNLLSIGIRWPCAGLLRSERLPTGGVAFVLLVLATVSFDGLSKTFWWLSLVEKNPLEFPGRTEMMLPNTLGLCITFLVFFSAFYAVQRLASWLNPEAKQTSSFIYSMIPIAFGYHFAHYLPTFIVDIQYALIALADPFGIGWNLFGTADWVVSSSYLANYDSAVLIWYLQISGIVLAHVGAVIVFHLLQLHENRTLVKTLQGQFPATVLMIAYTVFGIWLLSTPVLS